YPFNTGPGNEMTTGAAAGMRCRIPAAKSEMDVMISCQISPRVDASIKFRSRLRYMTRGAAASCHIPSRRCVPPRSTKSADICEIASIDERQCLRELFKTDFLNEVRLTDFKWYDQIQIPSPVLTRRTQRFHQNVRTADLGSERQSGRGQ